MRWTANHQIQGRHRDAGGEGWLRAAVEGGMYSYKYKVITLGGPVC